MNYLVVFLGGAVVGAAVALLVRRKPSGATPPPEVIKIIVERSIKAYKQQKKTEEIIKEIDDLLNK